VEAFEGFGLADADPLVGDEWARVVTRRARSDLSALAGRKVSVRIHMSRAKLFSVIYQGFAPLRALLAGHQNLPSQRRGIEPHPYA